MYNIYFCIIISVVVLNFVWEQILSYLNRKQMSIEVPEQLKGIYNKPEVYTKQQLYQKENSHFGLVSESFLFIIISVVLSRGTFGWLDTMLRKHISNTVLLPLIFFGIVMLTNMIINFPFSWYATFIIEKKFGFNRTTPKLFILDWLKSILLNVLIGGLILSITICIYQYTNKYFWLLAWGVVSIFVLLMNLFYSELIVPLFNKQTPLETSDLRNAIEIFTKKVGFEISNIYVIDGSKRSSKGNAYFTGMGKKKRIVLFDTLINELNKEEILSVLAHEIGHYKKKHIAYSIIGSIISTGITFYILSLFLDNLLLAKALGGNTHSFHLGLIGFSFLFTPISELTNLIFLSLSRKNEYEADAYAANFGLGETLISGLKKLSVHSLSNLNPHSWVVFWHYSHPTLLQRIKNLTRSRN
ncbi:Ste24-like endopeptidase [Candidatus Azobacteroides pseudotrichonymphae genomovar. CFP2]|uniref:Ste24-like endopeptidase n=2 Tax=Candidatus Azobacteroides TaxID=511434 RepID=B6YS26_AZOPC|nr:Ste24-like endopeptidase [Candidatus Azobacteroides pseudotrichonymphae genomovar. CFP2]